MSGRNCRRSFATETLSKISNRLQYYRKVLNNPKTNDKQRQRIQSKYDHDIKIRKLLNRALSHRYEYVDSSELKLFRSRRTKSQDSKNL